MIFYLDHDWLNKIDASMENEDKIDISFKTEASERGPGEETDTLHYDKAKSIFINM